MKKTIAMMLILVLALSLAGAAVAQTQKTSKPFRLPRVLSRVQATVVPTEEPTVEPTAEPTEEPTEEPTVEPTAEPTVEPTAEPTVEPTAEPTVEPTAEPLNIEAVVSIDNDRSALIVRKAPDANAEKVAKLHKGDRVTILAYEGDWARILFNDFLEGYVFAAYLTTEPVDEPSAAITARGDADVRVAADGLSEIFTTLPDGTALKLLAVEGDWAKVEVDGQIGYIYKDSVSGVEWPKAEPTENPDEENMKVTIFTSRRTVVEPGETITLTSRLEGFENCEIVVYQWQYDRGNGFEDIPGADADTYAFAADVETLSYDWRLVVYYA